MLLVALSITILEYSYFIEIKWAILVHVHNPSFLLYPSLIEEF